MQYIKNTIVNPNDIEVKLEQLEMEAKDYNITNLTSFFNASAFKQKYKKDGKRIIPK